MVRAKLTARTVSTQITPEPGSWTFRGGWAPNQAAIATELLSVKFKKLPVLSWPGATARYSSLTTPVETSTAPWEAAKYRGYLAADSCLILNFN